MRKNDVFTTTIEDIGVGGEGIGKVDGYTLFIKDTLPGEVIKGIATKIGPRYGYGRLMEILKPSPDRVEPRCPSARACGGCTLQHMSYEGQLVYKEKKVRDCLERIGGVDMSEVEWLPILGMKKDGTGNDGAGEDFSISASSMPPDKSPTALPDTPWHYRNKAQFPVQRDKEGNPVAGFYAGRSHRVISVDACAIQHPVINEVVDCVLAFMRDFSVAPYDEEKHSGLVRHIYVRRGYHTGQVMVCLVINGTALPHSEELVLRFQKIEGMTSISLNVNTKKTNVILGRQMIPLWGPLYIEDCIGDIRYRISPQSFYQINPIQTQKLYETALSFASLKGDERVWDLYCGIGTISLFFAKELSGNLSKMPSKMQSRGEVFGVEIVPEAVENAKENAKLNGIENVSFVCGAAEDVVPNMADKGADELSVDVVVVDPPRKGCDAALLDTMVRLAPERIVYVSCNPATLARDVKVLGEKGYEVKKVRAVDQFGNTVHVETVVLMSRKDK